MEYLNIALNLPWIPMIVIVLLHTLYFVVAYDDNKS